MPAPRLVLVPEDPLWIPESRDHLANAVIATGIADQVHDHDPMYLHAGDRFLDRLMFLGCAPTVEFEAPDNSAWGTASFYHVYIPEASAKTRFRSDRLSYKPRCPSCRQPLDEWQQWWGEGSVEARACPGCDSELTPEALNWRRRAGAGRCFIDIIGIHAETVKPSSQLFDELKHETGIAWRYFFVEDAG